jgi:hypothetical protein
MVRTAPSHGKQHSNGGCRESLAPLRMSAGYNRGPVRCQRDRSFGEHRDLDHSLAHLHRSATPLLALRPCFRYGPAGRAGIYSRHVTLNITLLTPGIIYQSADFRLTHPTTGAIITNKSAKTVGLQYPTWRGFVTYTGLGSWDGRAVSDWIAQWLAGKPDLGLADAAEILKVDGTKLIDTVRERTKRPRMRHTFTMAGFEGDKATVVVISNFQGCFGKPARTAAADLSVTSRVLRPRDKALVLVTGRRQAVARSDRRLLKRLASEYPDDGGRLRRRMEEITARAAASPNSANLISDDCVVLSFRIDGAGVLQLNNAGDNPNEFPQLMNGTNMADQMRSVLQSLGVDLGNMNLVQAVFASAGPGSHPAAPTRECRLSIAEAESRAGYELEELKTDAFDLVSPRDISNRGHVVGTGQPLPGQPQNIPWLYHSGKVKRLPYDGITLGVNNNGDVAGTIQGPDGSRAVSCIQGRLIEHPLYHGADGVFAGTDSTGRAINDAAVMAGNVRSQTEEQGRPNTRPAIFRVGEPPLPAIGVKAEHGSEALRINNRGVVLVIVSPAIFASRSILWDPTTDAVTYVGGPDAIVHPIALNDSGIVLGQAKDEQARPIAMICEPGEQWQRLGTDVGWAPIDMNNRGDVVGMVTIDRLQRPWLRLTSGEIRLLPYVREHHSTPAAINDAGEIVGSAGADHGAHTLLWRPQPSD